MLRILLATCETAIETFQAANDSVDQQFLIDLEDMAERIRGEFERITERSAT